MPKRITARTANRLETDAIRYEELATLLSKEGWSAESIQMLTVSEMLKQIGKDILEGVSKRQP